MLRLRDRKQDMDLVFPPKGHEFLVGGAQGPPGERGRGEKEKDGSGGGGAVGGVGLW